MEIFCLKIIYFNLIHKSVKSFLFLKDEKTPGIFKNNFCWGSKKKIFLFVFFYFRRLKNKFCSNFFFLHDLSSDRRKPGQFLSSKVPIISTKGPLRIKISKVVNFFKFSKK